MILFIANIFAGLAILLIITAALSAIASVISLLISVWTGWFGDYPFQLFATGCCTGGLGLVCLIVTLALGCAR